MNINTNNPPMIKIRKEKIRDHVENFLLPNARESGWDLLKIEFDYLEYVDSNLFILYKNEQPIGQYIETNYNDTICLSHFIVSKEERKKGYGNMLMEEFYTTHKNIRICCTSSPDMVEFYDKKLNLKQIKKSFNCTLEFDRKSMEQISESKSIQELKFSKENLEKVNTYFNNNFGYHRVKAAEFFLKKGIVFISSENHDLNGILCATKENNLIRIESLISDSFDVACDIFYNFLKNLPEEKFTIFMSVPQNDKFNEFLKTFSINYNQNNFVWILDTNLNCTYDNFYSISNATI